MKIEHIDHINISASRELIERIKEFYVNILGLDIGERPNFKKSGYWLYASEKAIMHLTVNEKNISALSTHLDHFALKATGISSTKNWLDSKGIKYKQTNLSEINQVQLFLTDPAGNGVELNFTGEINA